MAAFLSSAPKNLQLAPHLQTTCGGFFPGKIRLRLKRFLDEFWAQFLFIKRDPKSGQNRIQFFAPFSKFSEVIPAGKNIAD
jgi:hypothetical protein